MFVGPLSRRVYMCSTPGDEASGGGKDSGQKEKTAGEVQQNIDRMQTVLGWAEQMGDCDQSDTMDKIQNLQQERNEIIEGSLE